MANIIAIVQLVMSLGTQLNALVQQAIAAHQTDDQATLDSILAKVEGAANALAPGDAPAT